jgi:UDP-N-acetylmuramoyl-tripeptide--D-alanyl-D-alanine ligase
MIKRTLKEIQGRAKGEELSSEYQSVIVEGVSKDTREDMSGKLYIPIIGENFNGQIDYVRISPLAITDFFR